MEQIKEFISQISLNKYYDKRNNRKINKKVYIGYINGELYTGYKRKKTYTKKGALENSMVGWLAHRFCMEKITGRVDYNMQRKIMGSIREMLPQLIEEGIIEIKEVELIAE